MKIDNATKNKIEILSIEISQEMGKIEAHFRNINELKAEIMTIIDDYDSDPLKEGNGG